MSSAALGRYDEARDSFRRATVALERDHGADDVALAEPLTGWADVELATGGPATALPLLERAARIREKKEDDPVLLAGTRFTMARALWEIGKQRGRALALARAARDAYEAGHNAGAAREVDAWLASRSARRTG